ncbi:hypothetical protein G5B00_05990 [Parapedobacter sp. SGR-10]|uniref:hypothetical protein n=1 Tax=Parapedobacter sp. SGR-10 TaxID=2710879 RepID=UPI0013D80C9C|nr:hypothetical protein [Parapedobacter sp. SGR-10]NGF56062.1 hypothetical protein [Parapedobacter sp. SGR-10]
MKEEKEIIDYIVDRLKKSEGLPYKAGAWEKFRSEHVVPRASVYRMSRVWYAAASVLLLLGGWGAWYMTREVANPGQELVQTAPRQDKIGPSERVVDPEKNPAVSPSPDVVAMDEKGSLHADDMKSFVTSSPDKGETRLSLLHDESNIQVSAEAQIPSMLPLQGRDLSYTYSFISEEQVESTGKSRLDEHLASSPVPQGRVLAMKEVEPLDQTQRVRLNDKFELGVFVSPYATGQKMNVGGGFALAYKLSNKLSVRTGASYNTYEVNMLKDPVQEDSRIEAMVVEEKSALRMESASATAYQNKVVIPNINAIRGSVQAIDIPVELKFNVSRSFYTAAGLSYSAILHQERNAYYVDNVNKETFTDGYPENKQQAEETVKPITKSVESMENNVNTNGFSGFVNFSLGKEVKMNKRVGISVEPYLKIPVGQYRRADMDYTNGGIRIMTSF